MPSGQGQYNGGKQICIIKLIGRNIVSAFSISTRERKKKANTHTRDIHVHQNANKICTHTPCI